MTRRASHQAAAHDRPLAGPIGVFVKATMSRVGSGILVGLAAATVAWVVLAFSVQPKPHFDAASRQPVEHSKMATTPVAWKSNWPSVDVWRHVAGTRLTRSLPAPIVCDTPVYRFAMYQWRPAMYELYHIHDASEHDASESSEEPPYNARWRRRFDTWRLSLDAPNVMWIDLDVSLDPELNHVPAQVRALIEESPEGQKQGWFLSSPDGHAWRWLPPPLPDLPDSAPERYDETIAAVSQSPARATIARRLQAAQPCVFLFLEGENAADNQAALEMLDQWTTDVRNGTIKLRQIGPLGAGGDAPPSDGQFEIIIPGLEPESDQDSPPVETVNSIELHEPCSYLNVPYDAQVEAWLKRLVRPLPKWSSGSIIANTGQDANAPTAPAESIELTEDEHRKPRVYAVLGRGRALPALVGEDLNRDKLTEVLSFAAGACSCTIKELNPGLDLLMEADWDLTAREFVVRFGTEEGNEGTAALDEFIPQLLTGSEPDSSAGQGANDAESPSPSSDAQDEAIGGTSNDDALGDDALGDDALAAPSDDEDAHDDRKSGWSGPIAVVIGLIVVAAAFSLFTLISSARRV